MVRASETVIFLAAMCLGTAACSKTPQASAGDAQQLAAGLTGDARGSASDNQQCKMFTPAEIAAYEGAAVGAGSNAAMGTGCQWSDTSDNDSAMVQVVRASDHEPATAAPGYKPLPQVGQEGFVVPQMGGWHAAAISGGKSVNVQTGAKSDQARTVAFLQEAIKRLGR